MSYDNTTPIIELGRNLLVSLQGDLDDATVLKLEDDICNVMVRRKSLGALIDVSGLVVVDSFVARVLARLTSMLALLGADTVVVGIQPAVAITLVELGVDLRHVNTALNAGLGLELLKSLQSA